MLTWNAFNLSIGDLAMLPSFFPLDVCQPMYPQFYEPLTNITTNKLIEIHLQKFEGYTSYAKVFVEHRYK